MTFWFLVLVHFSDLDGRLLQTHRVAKFQTEIQCNVAKKEMRVSKRMKAICTQSPMADWKETK